MNQRDALSGLDKLEAEEYRPGADHWFFRVRCRQGHYFVNTKLSHKPGRNVLGPDLVAQMARQLLIQPAFWRQIAGCTRGRDDYLAVARCDRCSGGA